MTSLIFKYKLKANETQHVKLYKGSRILSAGVIDDDIYIWVMVDLTKPEEERTIVVYTTGYSVDGYSSDGYSSDDSKLKHIDTVIMNDGLVFHVFEEIS